ncbi:MAG: hypothetical protein AABX60_02960, partial [Nanoarchaeota archaeon]
MVKQVRKSYGFVFFLLLLVAILAYSVPVLGAVSSGTAQLNVSNSTYGFINFSDGTVSNLSGHVKWDNRSGIQASAWATSSQNGFFNASPGKIHAIGPKNNLSVYSVPNGSDKFFGGDHLFYEHPNEIIYSAGDGFAVMTNNNTYAFIEVIGILFGSHVNITWKFQSNGSPTFGETPSTGCLQHKTSAACWNASASGANCYWDEFLKSCQEGGSGGGGGGGSGGAINHTAECPLFDGNQKACGNITVCQYATSSGFCNANTNFDPAKGVTCSNFVNKSVCDNQPFTSPLCSWNSTGDVLVGNCSVNMTKTFSALPQSPFTNCEAAGNQSNCTLAIETYFMPCEWDGNKSKCIAELHGVFGGASGGNYFDINTKSSCEASGGTWKTEQYTYSDPYGNTQTAGASWCEPSFGNFGKEDCNDACWACEKQTDGTNWPD